MTDTPAAGWYADPEDAARERWWNGTGWSEERRAATVGRTDGLALAGLLVGAVGWIIAGVLASIAGIILSGLALARAKQREAAGDPGAGRGMATAGLVVGIAGTVIGLIVVVGYLAFLLTIGYAS